MLRAMTAQSTWVNIGTEIVSLVQETERLASRIGFGITPLVNADKHRVLFACNDLPSFAGPHFTSGSQKAHKQHVDQSESGPPHRSLQIFG